jgi:hypothetical protein
MSNITDPIIVDLTVLDPELAIKLIKEIGDIEAKAQGKNKSPFKEIKLFDIEAIFPKEIFSIYTEHHGDTKEPKATVTTYTIQKRDYTLFELYIAEEKIKYSQLVSESLNLLGIAGSWHKLKSEKSK